MSRVGRKVINIAEKVKVKVEDRQVIVEGPKGRLTTAIPATIDVEISDNKVAVKRRDDNLENIALHGMVRALINNMILGVSEGFAKQLEIVGVGYKAEIKGRELVLALGYSHPVIYPLPDGIEAKVDKQTRITISGCDKKLVGEVAAKVRRFRPPEPYKGKGIRYVGEIVKHKVGKAAAAAGSGA